MGPTVRFGTWLLLLPQNDEYGSIRLCNRTRTKQSKVPNGVLIAIRNVLRPAVAELFQRARTKSANESLLRYSGNADKALSELQTSLKYKPGHPQTLFNLGWVRWQGKADPKGAVEAWQQLLKANPDYPQKDQVEKYIAKAKEHSSRG
jgi:tetratricopeptide (TPR) repeat protein